MTRHLVIFRYDFTKFLTSKLRDMIDDVRPLCVLLMSYRDQQCWQTEPNRRIRTEPDFLRFRTKPNRTKPHGQVNYGKKTRIRFQIVETGTRTEPKRDQDGRRTRT